MEFQAPISEIEVDDQDREALVAFLKARKEKREEDERMKKNQEEKETVQEIMDLPTHKIVGRCTKMHQKKISRSINAH